MNLGTFKSKHVGAKKGFDLLKSKADALKARFRDICKNIYNTKIGMADQSATAFFSLTQAEYAAGNFRNKVLETNMSAAIRVTSRTDNVAGVKLPVFVQYDTGASESHENLGLVGGGRKIQACKERFGDYLKALIKVASLQTSFLAMDEALKVTNRRVNALENVTLPKIEGVISYINRELDELEREDFTRLKMVKKKKEEAGAENEKMAAAMHEAEQAAKAESDSPASPTKDKKKKKKKGGGGDVLSGADMTDDADVYFK
jgi:V-type H+-transporting ATPase subunit D